MDLKAVQDLYRSRSVLWSDHGSMRMRERGIRAKDVGDCLLSGEVIEEYPDDFPHPSCLVCGKDGSGRVLHVVVGLSERTLYVITAYEPSTDKFMDDLKTRRR